MKKFKILVFPCGSEIGLEIKRAFEGSKHFDLIGGTSIESEHGKYVYNHVIENIPYVESNDFITNISKIVKKYNIDLIFPAHDSVVLKLAQHQEEILPAKVVTSPLKTCEICRSKIKTYNFFNDFIPTPKIFNKKEIQLSFPIFLKPDVGQGSKGTKLIKNQIEYDFYINQQENLMVLEYLPGNEYTIDCFTDYNGNLLFVGGRERIRISNGISVDTKPKDDPRFNDIAQKINSKLIFNGGWFFQVKENINKELVLLEIAPRIAGSMALHRALGVNIPIMSAYNSLGIPINIIKNFYNIRMDRALNNKYKIDICYDYVYVDLDDTLIINNITVNYLLVAFLYKSINEKKKIILLTKHSNNVYDTLKKFRLNNLFDEIIKIDLSDEKNKYIKNTNSIFIDDSYIERKKIAETYKIPVFDVNMLEVLM